MRVLHLRHLTWVLWVSVLVAGDGGGLEDGVAAGGGGSEELVKGARSYGTIRHHLANNTSRLNQDNNKPPDDRQSTTISRIKNETGVDLSRNTVPVLLVGGGGAAAGGLAEGSKYHWGRPTTALPSGGGGGLLHLRKQQQVNKLRRPQANGGGEVSKPRPSELTTLLAFNALSGGGGARAELDSSTSAEAAGRLSSEAGIPPTGWALARLKGPPPPSRRRQEEASAGGGGRGASLASRPVISSSTPETTESSTEEEEDLTNKPDSPPQSGITETLAYDTITSTATTPVLQEHQSRNPITVSTAALTLSQQTDKIENQPPTTEMVSLTHHETSQSPSNHIKEPYPATTQPTSNHVKEPYHETTQPTSNQVKEPCHETSQPTSNHVKEPYQETPQPTSNQVKEPYHETSQPTSNHVKESYHETPQPTSNQVKEPYHETSQPTSNHIKEPYRNDTSKNELIPNETEPEKIRPRQETIHNENHKEFKIIKSKRPFEYLNTYKTEENTISVPPLSSLKNSTLTDFIGKKDLASNAHLVGGNSGKEYQESGFESRFETDSIFHNETSYPVSSMSTENLTLTSTGIPIVSESKIFNYTSESSISSDQPTSSENFSEESVSLSSTIVNLANTSSQINSITDLNTEIPSNAKFSTETSKNHETSSEMTLEKYDSPTNKSVHEIDPSLNVINEKKLDKDISTSTVVSAVNSSVSMHVALPLTTPRISNLTNLIDGSIKTPENQIEIAHKSPSLTSTTDKNDSQNSVTKHDRISSQTESNRTIINDIKPVLIPEETGKEPKTSTKTNDIPKNEAKIDEIKTEHDFSPDLPETTQSNYILHEIIKPQNKTVHLNSPENITETIVSPTTMKTTLSTMVSQFNVSTTESIVPVTYVDNANISSDMTEMSSSAVTTPLPVTTTPLSTITISSTKPPTSSSTSSAAPSLPDISTTSKSNDIQDQEVSPKDHQSLPIPEKNMTHYEYDSPNAVKNESTPSVIIQDPEEIEEEDESSLNQTSSSTDHQKNPDHGETDNDDTLDIIGSGNATSNDSSFTKSIGIPFTPTEPSSTTAKTTTKPASTTTNLDETLPTQIDEDPSGMDDDAVYDTGVILTVYIRLIFEATYNEMCREKDHLREAIVRTFKKYAERKLEKRQILLLSLTPRECASRLSGGSGAAAGDSRGGQQQAAVQLYLTDRQGQYDKLLNDILLALARRNQIDFKYPITQIEKVVAEPELSLDMDAQPSGTVVAAIVISSIAAVCLLALTVLLVIMRKRQSGFNYGQRCTPVSLDDYSLDNISVYNSVRRKALRASKRSYGNPAFDDPDVVSNPVNFAGLANMASNKAKTDEEFSNLPTVTVRPDELPPGAETKNRYANVIPLPETRVHLQGNTPQEQFINANYVRGAKEAEKFYIACQAPMQNTIDDFWKMIWDEQSRLIIMLTALTENGVEKCADYLPASEVLDCHRLFGHLQVTLKKREAREKYVISSLQLKNLETNSWREVTHMWYAGWPPTGVPAEAASVIALLIEGRAYLRANGSSSGSGPLVVHCSPGTGRTGTLLAIDIAIRDLEAGRTLDVPKTVIQVRRGRAGAVQTKEQYHFIYKVLHLYATKLTGGSLDSI